MLWTEISGKVKNGFLVSIPKGLTVDCRLLYYMICRKVKACRLGWNRKQLESLICAKNGPNGATKAHWIDTKVV